MAGPFGIVRYGREEMVEDERQMDSASADIEPGMLLERLDDGGDVVVQPHSTAAEQDPDALVAVPARDRGMNAPTGDSDEEPDVYSTSGDDFVRFMDASGGGLYMLLAAGENVTAGASLVSNGDGYLRQLDTAGGDDPNAVAFETEEAVDNSGGSSAVFIEVTPA